MSERMLWWEQRTRDLPAGESWLTASELSRLATFRVPKRRADWLLGRWTAKRAVIAYLGLADDPATLSRLEIRTAPSGAPQAWLDGAPAPVAISISHCAGTAACIVAPAAVALGCDLEKVEPRSPAFVRDYFTGEEQGMVGSVAPADQPFFVTLVWSSKESALKALHAGLRLDTRSVRVTLDPEARGDWRSLHVNCDASCAFRIFEGWWSVSGNLVRTFVCGATLSGVRPAIPLPKLPVPPGTAES